MTEPLETQNPLRYEPLPNVFDEMQDADGRTRGLWQSLEYKLANLGPMGIQERDAKARQLLDSDGATFHVYGDPEGMHRRWPLDPLPLLIAADEWQQLEPLLIQRALLLNRVLEDIYGEQRLIRDKVIPGRILWNHPAYTRSCHGIHMPGPYDLPFYAADLTRDHQGQFLVIGDRTQIPTGTGYALENRMVMTRLFPDLFSSSHVHRLARFFADIRDCLEAAAGGLENPRIVVLSPGTHNESYFEQSYMANYLGYSLVEGSDLFVRKGRVWIKTLAEPEAVDVILRRVDYDYSDPLEFRGDSLLGIPGLTEVARRGNVAIVNPLGAGILENTALFSFLPTIASYFGLPAGLPQTESFWCGEPQTLDRVLDELPSLVIKSVYAEARRDTVVGSGLSPEELKLWRAKIAADPDRWVGQTMVEQATVPAKGTFGVEKRHAVVRTYLAGTREGYAVMQGGLTRISHDTGPDIISNQSGSPSKDTWIVSREESEKSRYFWIHPHHKLSDKAPEFSVSGRMAENLFWMGRYAERAAATSQLMRQLIQLLENDAYTASGYTQHSLSQLLPALTHLTASYPGFAGTKDLISRPAGELFSLVDDSSRIGSLAHSLRSCLNSSNEVRDLLSQETRSVFNRIQLMLLAMHNQPLGDFRSMDVRLSETRLLILSLSTLFKQSMVQGLAWYFLELGRRMEKALNSLSLQQSTFMMANAPAEEEQLLEALLGVFDSGVTYRNRYGSGASPDIVLDLLLLESQNPRSVLYQLLKCQSLLQNLPNHDENSGAERNILEAISRLRLTVSGELTGPGDDGQWRPALGELYGTLHRCLSEASSDLAKAYFTKTTDHQRILTPL